MTSTTARPTVTETTVTSHIITSPSTVAVNLSDSVPLSVLVAVSVSCSLFAIVALVLAFVFFKLVKQKQNIISRNSDFIAEQHEMIVRLQHETKEQQESVLDAMPSYI